MELADKNTSFSSNKNNVAEILFEFIRMALKDEEFYARIGNVVSVDEAEKTATVQLVDGGEIEGVRLQQVPSDTGIFVKPSVDSLVVVAFTDKTTAYIAMFSQVDEYVFQNGVNGGLIKINDIVAKLNGLVGEVNDMWGELKVHVHTSAAAGSPTTPPAPPLTSSDASDFDKDDFENDKFTH